MNTTMRIPAATAADRVPSPSTQQDAEQDLEQRQPVADGVRQRVRQELVGLHRADGLVGVADLQPAGRDQHEPERDPRDRGQPLLRRLPGTSGERGPRAAADAALELMPSRLAGRGRRAGQRPACRASSIRCGQAVRPEADDLGAVPDRVAAPSATACPVDRDAEAVRRRLRTTASGARQARRTSGRSRLQVRRQHRPRCRARGRR